MKRLVVVADNPLIVGAIRSGLRSSGTFELLGYTDPSRATAASIVRTGADVVLVDEADGSDSAIALIRGLKEHDDDIQVIVLTLQMKGEWLERAATEHCSLTERELEILQLVASGATNGDIARQLWITQQTVKFHVSNIYRKLDVGNRTEACHYAHVNGLVFERESTPEAIARKLVAAAS